MFSAKDKRFTLMIRNKNRYVNELGNIKPITITAAWALPALCRR